MDYRPKRTLRAVMFMNEENGLRGGRKYAELAKKNGEYHLAAMESDRGGFYPLVWRYRDLHPTKKRSSAGNPCLNHSAFINSNSCVIPQCLGQFSLINMFCFG